MSQAELRESLRVHPFEPFRIHLMSGMVFEVRHPEMALLTRHSVHVVALEPVNGRNGRGPARRHRRSR